MHNHFRNRVVERVEVHANAVVLDLADSYVLMKDGEAWLLGAMITPLDTASTHFVTDPTRTRKLLLHRKELQRVGSQ